MKKVAKLLSYLSAFFGGWILLRAPAGITGGVMWLPKLWAGAWAPFLALSGSLGALLGMASGGRRAVWFGLFGAIAAGRHTARVVARNDGFARAFGLDWEARIPPDLRTRLNRNRYQLAQPNPPSVPGRRDVKLAVEADTGMPLLCDIWQPPDRVPRTGLAMIYLHGGLWQELDKDFLTQPLFRRLAGQGHVIVDLAYSLTPRVDLFHMMKDVKRAIVWLKAHSAEYGVNPDRIVLMGASGGGHLALLAAYTPNHHAFQPADATADTSVRAVVSLYGVTDLAAFFHEYRQMCPRQPAYSSQITDDLRPRLHDRTLYERFLTRTRALPAYRHRNMPGGHLLLVYLLGGTLNEVPEVYRLGSPVAHIGAHCPPTLQIFGDNDFAVDSSHGRRLHQVLRESGIASVYVELPDTVHAFDQYIGVSRCVAPAAQTATYDIERFLALMV